MAGTSQGCARFLARRAKIQRPVTRVRPLSSDAPPNQGMHPTAAKDAAAGDA